MKVVFTDTNNKPFNIYGRKTKDINNKSNNLLLNGSWYNVEVIDDNWYKTHIHILDKNQLYMCDSVFYNESYYPITSNVYLKTAIYIPKILNNKPTMALEVVKEETKPQKKKTIPKKIKIMSWNLYIGEDNITGKCYCCNKTTITISDFHCGHYVSEFNGGETHITNLRPICSGCNLSMGKNDMEEFKKMIQ